MRRSSLCAGLAALFLTAHAPSAHAMGFGAFFEYANVFDAQLDTDFGPDLDYDEDHYAGGFSFDTNVASDRLFNYRLDLGYEHVDGDYGGSDESGDGIVMDNGFGFGVVRNENLRLWVGPALRLSYDVFDNPDVEDFGIGAGPEIGLNLHTASNLSFAITAGYQILYVNSSADHGNDVDGYEQLAFVRLAVLFRTMDDVFGG